MNRERAPHPELSLRQADEVAERRENEECRGVQEKHGRERNGHFLSLGAERSRHRGNCAAAANRSPDCNECRGVSLRLEQFR